MKVRAILRTSSSAPENSPDPLGVTASSVPFGLLHPSTFGLEVVYAEVGWETVGVGGFNVGLAGAGGRAPSSSGLCKRGSCVECPRPPSASLSSLQNLRLGLRPLGPTFTQSPWRIKV